MEAAPQATYLSLLIIGGIFVPVGLRTIWGVRKGTYTNMDVSDQNQRQRWFIATTILLLIVTAVVWVTGQNEKLRIGMVCALLLLIVAQLMNTRLKVSMHMAYHMFLGVLMLHFSTAIGVAFLCVAPVLAWSRVYLRRHVWKEVWTGAALGSAFGLAFLYFVG